jgi:hypothetical protein
VSDQALQASLILIVEVRAYCNEMLLYTVYKLQVCDKLLQTSVSFCLPSFSSALVADSKACFWVVAAS